MNLSIDRDALELAFRVLLSCRCPVTPEQELALFRLLEAAGAAEPIGYDRVLGIFPAGALSPFHRLGQFAGWVLPAHAERVIQREHVLRHFASSYHWDHVVAAGLSSAYVNVVRVAPYLVGHQLLPVRLCTEDDGSVSGTYTFAGGEVALRHLFLPPGYEPDAAASWAVHLAAVLSPLSPEEDALVRLMGDDTPGLVQLRPEVQTIDYADFQRFGDYRRLCEERHRAYWGEGGR